jgi:Family of unknown function (DUF6527)
MSDGKVRFGNLDGLDAPPGQEQTFSFTCGEREQPTFTPSINCGHCGWHGYLRGGRCVDTSGVDEP